MPNSKIVHRYQSLPSLPVVTHRYPSLFLFTDLYHLYPSSEAATRHEGWFRTKDGSGQRMISATMPR
ncbi:MAG: hypothetical protein JHC32_04595 [Candidatus Aminicenantes bacterium]|nr:hypothetical protein [Candidatus Aminicenantes bacterium]